jgi:hypothetical protein
LVFCELHVTRPPGCIVYLAGIVGPRRADDKLPLLHYKEGETLRELSKYLPPGAEEGQCVQVRIPAEAMTPLNRQARRA